MLPDELHASYSKNLANQSVQKGLIKFAKDRGLASPEIWQHNGSWAMRYTGADGEVHNLSLGEVFAKARAVIASLSKPKLASLSGDPLNKGLKKGARVKVNGKAGVVTAIGLSASGKLLAVVKFDDGSKAGFEQTKLKAVKASLGGKKLSQSDDVARLKKMFPDAQVSVTPDGQFKIRSSKINVTDKDLNAVIKKAKTMSGLSLAAKRQWSVSFKGKFIQNEFAATAKEAMNTVADDMNLKPEERKLLTAKPNKPGYSLSHPLDRLNALSLSEVVYHAGYYMQGGKRIGKTEAEATEKLS